MPASPHRPPPSKAPAPKPAPSKATTATRTADALRSEILDGLLAPGAKVNLDRLRGRLGVSLAPVREAMGRLVAEGLVEFEDQRGYRVTPVSRRDLAEVGRLRQELEVLGLGLSIDRGSLDWEAGVLAALHRLDAAAGAPAAERHDRHAAFHAALLSGAEMPILAGLCARFLTLQDRYRRLLPAGAAPPRDLPGEHAAIARAAIARNRAEACRLIAAHVARTGTCLAEGLSPVLPEAA